LLPPPPNPQALDSIRFKNGEVPRGEIKALRHYHLLFDSDQLDYLKIDWDDVAELRSSRHNTIVLNDFETVFGTVLIKHGQIVVGTESGPRRFRRSELNSLVPGEQTGFDYWSGKLNFGLTAQSGNSDQTTINSKAALEWRSPYQRVSFAYLGNYGKVEGDETANNHRGLGSWRIDLTEKWFVIPVRLDVYRDLFQNVALQYTPGTAVGYNLANTSTLQFGLGLGLGWRHTEFDSVSSGEDNDDATTIWYPALGVDWDITSDIELKLNLISLIAFDDTNDSYTYLDATLSLDLIDDFDLDITVQWDRIGEPQPDSGGNTPAKDDFRYSVSLGWNF
jgi:putative salt-induced outer membrane protein YdiY